MPHTQTNKILCIWDINKHKYEKATYILRVVTLPHTAISRIIYTNSKISSIVLYKELCKL